MACSSVPPIDGGDLRKDNCLVMKQPNWQEKYEGQVPWTYQGNICYIERLYYETRQVIRLIHVYPSMITVFRKFDE